MRNVLERGVGQVKPSAALVEDGTVTCCDRFAGLAKNQVGIGVNFDLPMEILLLEILLKKGFKAA